jgi:hypothetical protein
MKLADILAKKAKTSTAAAAASGIKITPESEKAQIAKTIKLTLDATAPKIMPLTPPAQADPRRELGAMEPGERIPMNHAPQGTPDALWISAVHSFQTDLCIIMEPSPSPFAWLAVSRKHSTQEPILIHRLPLANLSHANNPF